MLINKAYNLLFVGGLDQMFMGNEHTIEMVIGDN